VAVPKALSKSTGRDKPCPYIILIFVGAALVAARKHCPKARAGTSPAPTLFG